MNRNKNMKSEDINKSRFLIAHIVFNFVHDKGHFGELGITAKIE